METLCEIQSDELIPSTDYEEIMLGEPTTPDLNAVWNYFLSKVKMLSNDSIWYQFHQLQRNDAFCVELIDELRSKGQIISLTMAICQKMANMEFFITCKTSVREKMDMQPFDFPATTVRKMVLGVNTWDDLMRFYANTLVYNGNKALFNDVLKTVDRLTK